MTSSGPVSGQRPARPGLTALCNRIDAINEAVGWLLGPMIVLVSGAILYEVISRGVFSEATRWVNEATIYGSASVYLLAGGYAMLHRRHVRIDAIFGVLTQRARQRLELLSFPFIVAYVLTLIIVGGDMAWTAYQQGEGTGTPWNPPIWPVKACIPAAGVLLLLQSLSNLLRDLGIVETRAGEKL